MKHHVESSLLSKNVISQSIKLSEIWLNLSPIRNVSARSDFCMTTRTDLSLLSPPLSLSETSLSLVYKFIFPLSFFLPKDSSFAPLHPKYYGPTVEYHEHRIMRLDEDDDDLKKCNGVNEEDILKAFLEEDFNSQHYDSIWEVFVFKIFNLPVFHKCSIRLKSTRYEYFQCLQHNRRAIAVNGFIIVFLIIYTTIGGFIFLNFEFEYQQYMKQNATLEKRLCIESLLNRDNRLRLTRASDVAAAIAERCLTENVSWIFVFK